MNILLMCLSEPSGDPRPRRNIDLFKQLNYSVDLVSYLPKDADIRKYLPRAVDVKGSTEEDLTSMGRKTYAHEITGKGPKLVSSSLVPIRNKKNGRVIMFSGSLEQIKAVFGDDYEIVESAIKDDATGVIDLDLDSDLEGR